MRHEGGGESSAGERGKICRQQFPRKRHGAGEVAAQETVPREFHRFRDRDAVPREEELRPGLDEFRGGRWDVSERGEENRGGEGRFMEESGEGESESDSAGIECGECGCEFPREEMCAKCVAAAG